MRSFGQNAVLLAVSSGFLWVWIVAALIGRLLGW
jgi:hypothetical protein